MINTIIEARKRQKMQIENAELEKMGTLETMQQQVQPLINAVDTQTQELKQVIGQQQINASLPLKTPHMAQIKGPIINTQPWVQQIIAKSIGNRKSILSPYEIKVDNGRLGKHGWVDVERLMNRNEIIIKVKDKVIFEALNPPQGLVALLLLSGPDITTSRIKPTKEDINEYRRIMFKCGINKHPTSQKYKKYLKNIFEMGIEEMEVDDDDGLVETPTKSGSGVIPYNVPSQLEHRFRILAGGYRAGNRSQIVKDEMRSILDELLSIHQIIPDIHKRFYEIYRL